MSDAPPAAACAFHPESSALGACADCRAELCPRCAIPGGDDLRCPDCWHDRESSRASGVLEPAPLVLGWLAVATGCASVAAGAYLIPTLASGLVALGWGLWRHLSLLPGRRARPSVLAWTLGALSLVLCGLKIHLYGPGLAGVLVR